MTGLHELDGPTEEEFLERDVVVHPTECGPCEECAAAGYRPGSTGPKSTAAGLLDHAKKYGVEGVWDASAHLAEDERARLRVELDAIERGRKSPSGYTVGETRRRTQAETIEAVRMLLKEGLVVGAIADKLGLKESSAKWYIRKAKEGNK